MAIFGRGRRRTFARGFSVAACLYLLVAYATPHSARWEEPMAVSAALWLFVQLQRTRETELQLILATLEVAVASLGAGWADTQLCSSSAGGRKILGARSLPYGPSALLGFGRATLTCTQAGTGSARWARWPQTQPAREGIWRGSAKDAWLSLARAAG